jgi:hypothetical protein
MSSPAPLARDRQANGGISFVEMFAWKDTSSPEPGCRSRRRDERGERRAPLHACVADDDPPPQAETRRPRRPQRKGGPCARARSWSVYERSAGGSLK